MRRTPVGLHFAHGPWRNRFGCSCKQGLASWLRPCVGRRFGLARLQLWPIAYRYLRQVRIPDFAFISTFPPNKRVIRLAQRRTLSLHVCLQTKNAQIVFLSDTRPTSPAAASSAELAQTMSSQEQNGGAHKSCILDQKNLLSSYRLITGTAGYRHIPS